MQTTTTAKVLRPLSGPIRIRTPYKPGNRAALNTLAVRTTVRHLKGDQWELARRLFRPAVALLAERFGEVHVYTEHKTSQRCDRRCAEAKGDDCVCSCLYVNHGGGIAGWNLIPENTLVRGDVTTAHYVVRAMVRA